MAELKSSQAGKTNIKMVGEKGVLIAEALFIYFFSGGGWVRGCLGVLVPH